MAYAIAHTTSILDFVQDTANTLWNGFIAKVVLSTKRVQVSQLTQAMRRLSDDQLAQVGITRSEIDDYVRMTIRFHG